MFYLLIISPATLILSSDLNIHRQIAQPQDLPSYMQMSSFVEHAATGQKGTLQVAVDAQACMMSSTTIHMPAAYFSSSVGIPTANLVSLDDPNVFEAKILQDIVSPSTCSDFKRTWPNFVRDGTSNLYYVEGMLSFERFA